MSLLRSLRSAFAASPRPLLGLALGLAAVTLVSCGHDQVTDPVVNLGPVLAGAPLPPVASYTMITQGPVAKSILTVDGSASSDPNAGGGITNYAWSWGDGTAVQNTGTTPKAVHAYQAPGTFTLGLTVTNTAALTNTATQSITVAKRDTFTISYAPTTPAAGQAISFTPVNAAPPAGDTSSFQWTFPGKVATQYSSLAAPTGITYDSAGTWSVRVQRSYRSGPRQIITQPITIGAAVAPTGSVSCSAGLAADTVSNGSSVTCTPTLTANSGALSTYAWTETGGTPATAATSNYTFTFNSGASLTPSLTATNTYGKSGTFSYTLTAAPPAGSISCSPTTVTNGTSVTCSSASVTPGAGTLSTYAWSETGGTPATATTASYTFTWNTGASLMPGLTATNSYGRSFAFTSNLTKTVTQLTHVAMSTVSTCARTAGTAKFYCWGNDNAGQFATGTLSAPSGTDSAYVSLTSGYPAAGLASLQGGTCGLTSTGTAYCWGYDSNGEMGNNATNTNGIPTITAVNTTANATWGSLYAGDITRCGIAIGTNASKGYCWGDNANGVVGAGSTSIVNYKVPTIIAGAHLWSSLAVSRYTTCGVTTANVGFCWGAGSGGQMGNNTVTVSNGSPVAISTTNVATWTKLAVNDGQEACGIAAGTGLVWCWGLNSDNAIGNGTTTQSKVPVRTSSSLVFTDIQGTYNGFCGLSGSKMYCWGTQGSSEFGNGGTPALVTVPTLAFGGNTISALYTHPGSTVVCATYQATGQLMCAGQGGNGQLGANNANTTSPTPVPVYGIP